uniref:tetratricopeptide repeat-containing sulfotransferase family protein n=1 Tax=Ningiella ruwaisensis TaxID=2364274 RepID=UPI001F4FE701|nr:tetratricopeptide repeat-containing sulfotransferase family protein [Ningiella ruwaisensis]
MSKEQAETSSNEQSNDPVKIQSAQQTIKSLISQGNFHDAINQCREHLSTQDNGTENNLSDKITFLYLLSVSYRLSGEFNKAIETNKQILTLKSSHARAHQELAYVYRNQNQSLQAAKHFYSATQINPALLSSWKALLSFYQDTQNLKAVKLAQGQIDYLEALPKPILHARDLIYDGQLYGADRLCRQYLQQHKHEAEAMLLLAEIGIKLKVYNDAEFLLESLLALYPEHKAGGLEYLKLLSKMGRFQAAKDCADTLLKAHPMHPPIVSAKASAMVGLGELDQAIALYQQLIDNTSEQAALYLLLGHALKAKGEFDKAISAYQNAYKQRADFGDAYWSLANTKTYKFSDKEVSHMQEQIEKQARQQSISQEQDHIDADDKIHFYFALGKAQEDQKNYDAAFDYYSRGNALKRSQLDYKPEIISQQVANQKRVFMPSLFDALKGCGCEAPDPIFIVGLPRAGSTLLEQILASHSKVDGTMELHNIMALVSRLRGSRLRGSRLRGSRLKGTHLKGARSSEKGQAYPDMLEKLDPQYFARFGQQYIQDTRVYRDAAPFFIDKMPNNFMHIGLIKLILPNAKVIDARREPMACCFSGFKQLFGEGQEFTYGLDDIAQYYLDYVEMMAHWDRVLPDFVLRVQHEDVLNDLEGQVRRILKFCNLEFEQSCLDFHKTKRVIKTPSSEQVRQPIFKSSVEQWKHFSEQLHPLKERLADIL